jgi:hypothetical protein
MMALSRNLFELDVLIAHLSGWHNTWLLRQVRVYKKIAIIMASRTRLTLLSTKFAGTRLPKPLCEKVEMSQSIHRGKASGNCTSASGFTMHIAAVRQRIRDTHSKDNERLL